MLVRERQEVQALPRRQLRWPRRRPPPGGRRARARRPPRCAGVAARAAGRGRTVPRHRPPAERRAELEKAASEPGLWDDPDHAREVTTELGRVNEDLELLAGLAERALRRRDPQRAHRRGGRRVAAARRSKDASPTSTVGSRTLELRSLFAGEYDDGDAVAEIHAGAGGTDAQDWAEMMLRMYTRWAERRGFEIEVEEATPGQEAGLLSATFIVRGRYAFGLLAAERGTHRLVRMSPFDAQHRRQTSFASLDVVPVARGRRRPGRDRREGPPHRHLPFVGSRRPARQQDRLGGPHHPPAHRHRGVLPEPAQPASEQGQGPRGARGQAGRAAAGRAPGHPRRAVR